VDGYYLEAQVIAAVSRRISTMSFDERAQHPCIGRDRADLVIAGCAILEALLEIWPASRLRVADRGLREGILFTLMRQALPSSGLAHSAFATGTARPQ
jgi:exopolyphosphatase/guanosine-5'-triphosphate,3'-diphosphate pyrophosphatase